MRDEHGVTGGHLDEHVDGSPLRSVDLLVADGLAAVLAVGAPGERRPPGVGVTDGLGLEVVDLLELALLTGPVGVVLVRRVGGPAGGGGDDLADEDLLGARQRVEHAETAHLAAARPRSALLDGHPVGADHGDLAPPTARVVDPGAADRDACLGVAGVGQLQGCPRRGVEHVGGAGEDARATGQHVLGAVSGHAHPADERHDERLLALEPVADGRTRREHGHPDAGVLPAVDLVGDLDGPGASLRREGEVPPVVVGSGAGGVAHAAPPWTRSAAMSTAVATSPSGG